MAEIVVGLVLLLAVVLLALLAVRRFRLIRAGGVDVALRRVRPSAPTSTRGWNLGVGRYRGGEFAWFRVISLRGDADVVLHRAELEVVDRRSPDPTEEYVLPAGATVLRCRDSNLTVELAMPAGALTGFLSWLEAAPPGRRGYRRAS